MPGEAQARIAEWGWAEWDAAGDTADDLMRRADAALYRAKELGRDQVCGEPAPTPA